MRSDTRRVRVELTVRMELVVHDGAPAEEIARRAEGALRERFHRLPGQLRIAGARISGYPGVTAGAAEEEARHA